MKIKTNNEHIQNSLVNFPVVGKLQVVNGEIDVPEEVAQLLLQNEDWEEIDGTSSSDEDNTTKEEKKTADSSKKKKEEIVDELSSLGIEELIDIAKNGKIKGWQVLKTKPEGLRNLIRKNLNGK